MSENNEVVVGVCSCGGYGIVLDAEARQERGVCHIAAPEWPEPGGPAPAEAPPVAGLKRGWVSGHVTCDVCNHRHPSVHHTDSPRLECPGCGHMTRNPDFVEGQS